MRVLRLSDSWAKDTQTRDDRHIYTYICTLYYNTLIYKRLIYINAKLSFYTQYFLKYLHVLKKIVVSL